VDGARYPRMSDSFTPKPMPALHQRRPRYRGKNPRRFEEKCKEHDPQRYEETIAKVLAAAQGRVHCPNQQSR